MAGISKVDIIKHKKHKCKESWREKNISKTNWKTQILQLGVGLGWKRHGLYQKGTYENKQTKSKQIQNKSKNAVPMTWSTAWMEKVAAAGLPSAARWFLLVTVRPSKRYHIKIVKGWEKNWNLKPKTKYHDIWDIKVDDSC